MSYARSRLWLGISGVGMIVMLSLACLLMQLPPVFLPTNVNWGFSDPLALMAVFCSLVSLMLPLDLMGGYILPKRAGRGTAALRVFAVDWARGVAVQASFFVLAGIVLLASGRTFGLVGASIAVSLLCLLLVSLQLRIGLLAGTLERLEQLCIADGERVEAAIQLISTLGWRRRRLVLLSHRDEGFTGGVVGLPGRERIVVPAAHVKRLSTDELAASIARRVEAIEDGSRTRGLIVAFAWVLIGFNLSAMLPGSGVTSVAELGMTCLGFTLWTFLGLLLLPSVSRQAVTAIDSKVVARGVPSDCLARSVSKLDKQQDDEPERPRLIETIFHPVPSVTRRRDSAPPTTPIAWHVARMTLFLSWACMGILVRAVHCNVGRPDLWVMYPTD